MADADALLNAYEDIQADQNIQARYAPGITSWDIAHHRDRRGYLPQQAARWRQYVAATTGEFGIERAAFWQWLVKNGRVKQ